MIDNRRGPQFESKISKDFYTRREYLGARQLGSHLCQFEKIMHLQPRRVLEIGIGNGLTSAMLKCFGIQVVTADINAGLGPDVHCSIQDLPENLSDTGFDLVVCCEVLEHLPFEEFIPSIDTLSSYGEKVLITLPSNNPWFGLAGMLKAPLFERWGKIGLRLPIKRELCDTTHFWEVGLTQETSVRSIKRLLKDKFSIVESGALSLNPHHIYFECSSS